LIQESSPIWILTAAVTARCVSLLARTVLSTKSNRMDEGLTRETGPDSEREPANAERIRILQNQIADLRKRLPRHSVPPAMLMELEDLEEELEKELAQGFL
jgi:hypothetical protein